MKQLPPSILAVLLLSTAPALAQATFRLGLRGGANRALTTLDAASANGYFYAASADKAPIYAWQAGVAAEVTFGKIAFQPALLFSQKGERLTTSVAYGDFGVTIIDRTSTNHYNWLELPLNVVYTRHGDHGFQLFAGPYVALAVGGRQRGTTATYPLYSTQQRPPTPTEFNIRSEYGADTSNRRLDTGVSFGVGYRRGPLQLQLGYGLGLRNLRRSPAAYGYDTTDAVAYNRVMQLTGTYFFRHL